MLYCVDIVARVFRALRTMLSRQVTPPTPSKCSYPVQLLSCRQIATVTPLAATLMDSLVCVANKRLTLRLTPLNATLTKNRGCWATPIDVQALSPSAVPTFRPIFRLLPLFLIHLQMPLPQPLSFDILTNALVCGVSLAKILKRNSNFTTMPAARRSYLQTFRPSDGFRFCPSAPMPRSLCYPLPTALGDPPFLPLWRSS
jgi:hypothetical protein